MVMRVAMPDATRLVICITNESLDGTSGLGTLEPIRA
jgi:hypothetical protein